MKNILQTLPCILLLLSMASVSGRAFAAEPTNLDSLDCKQLYQLASLLEPQSQRYESVIFNNKSRLITTAIGTVDNAAFSLFGVDLAWSYYEEIRRLGKGKQLDLVRQQMSSKFCFERS